MIWSRFIVVLFLFPFYLISQISTWKTEDGLSNEWISNIVQDSNGYIWMGTQYGLNRFDGYEFSAINYIPNNQNSLSGNWIRSLQSDKKGNIYLNCFYGGLHLLDPLTGHLDRITQTEDGPIPISIKKLFVDHSNNLWVAGEKFVFRKSPGDTVLRRIPVGGGIDIDQAKNGLVYILGQSEILTYGDKIDTLLKVENGIYKQTFIDSDDNIWLLSKDGISRLIRQNDSLKILPFQIPDFNSHNVFYETAIFEDQHGVIWVAGEQGISQISEDRKTVKYLPFDGLFKKHRSNLEILNFLEDKHSNIWLGTNRGLHMLPHNYSRFEIENPFFKQISKVNGARSIQQINGKAWVGAERGLFEISDRGEVKKILNKSVYSLHFSKDSVMYIGTSQGMYVKYNVQSLMIDDITPKGLKSRLIWDITEDIEGNIWYASMGALNRYNPIKKEFIHFNSNNNSSLEDINFQGIAIDKEGSVWGGSLSSGVFKLTNTYDLTGAESAKFRNYRYEENDPNSLSNNIVLCITASDDGSIWVGTDGGLNQITSDGRINKFLKGPKLIDDKFMSLIFDDNNVLWASTISHGIMSMDLSSPSTTFFDIQDGLASNNYLLNSGFINDSGTLFFGSDTETQVINSTKALLQKKIKTDLLFTELTYLTSSIDSSIFQNISNGESIEIPYHKAAFSVSFSTIQFNQSNKTEYQYRILPILNTWQSNGVNRKITFNSLKYGNYELQVRAENQSLDLQPKVISLKLNILPPWWQNGKAYAFYILAFLALIYLVLRRLQERAQVSKIQEINQLKTKLYTNITHEIRTPLTVILGLSKKLMSTQKKSVAHSSEIIFRNGNHLLLLVNRILDLSKIESGKMPIMMEQGNIISYFSYLLESFRSLSEDKDIRLHFLPKEESIIMDYDPEIIKQILNNLISNAIKYTPVGNDVYCQFERSRDCLMILIKDTGKGIEQESLPFLFDRFYQEEAAQNSSGIGLAITKELVELLGGYITVFNNLNKGCTFTIKLPITINAPIKPDIPNQLTSPLLLEGHNTLDQILIVEDNQDIAAYIQDCLKGRFSTIVAPHGRAGLARAKELVPDLIISDLMMPFLSGIELSKILRKDAITSHIPIIILTARGDQNSKNDGLKSGADAYLTKPFDSDELLIQIENLLNIRRVLRLKYSDVSAIEFQDDKSDIDPFVRNLVAFITKHLSDSNFGINQICRHLGISRVHLHRKLKALTNQSTSIFIREIRLSAAYKLLGSTELNISEVSYEVGFNDPAYFSKLFSEKYGIPPSQLKMNSNC